MAMQTQSKANYAFKILLGKSHTGNNKELFNEGIASSIILNAQRIWANPIYPDPLDIQNAQSVSELVTLNLSLVSGSNIAYEATIGATVPTSLVGKTNPLTLAEYQPYDRVGNIIPDSYGQDFRPILKNNGVEVPPGAAADWFLDFFAGVITQENDTDSPLLNLVNGTLECYMYIGKFVSEAITSSTEVVNSGIVDCDTINDIYTINHITINPLQTVVLLNVISPMGYSLLLSNIIARTATSFTVELSDIPAESGYKIHWQLSNVV